MTYSLSIDEGDGSTVAFSVPAHLSTSHITVKVNGVTKTLGTDYTYTATNTITFGAAPSAGSIVLRERSTSPATPLVSWTSGANITKDNLDKSFRQCFYLAQEALDASASGLAFDPVSGKLDAGNRAITHVATPTAITDVATKAYVDALIALNGGNLGSGTLSTFTLDTVNFDDGLGHHIWSFQRSGASLNRFKLRDTTAGIDAMYWFDSGAVVMPYEVQVGNEQNVGFLRLGWDGLETTPVFSFGNHEGDGFYWSSTISGPFLTVNGHRRQGWGLDGALHLAIADNGNDAVKVLNTVNQVNRLELSGAVTGGAVKIAAAGSDTNISLQLVPKGTGRVVLPTKVVASNSANGTGFDSYIVIKDAAGTTLYLPTSVIPW